MDGSDQRGWLAGMPVLAVLISGLVPIFEARAHIVEQLYGEISVAPEAGEWRAVIYFDAGFALPEMRADKKAPPPRVAWLRALSSAEHARIRAGAEEYLREVVAVRRGDELLQWNIGFPDFAGG